MLPVSHRQLSETWKGCPLLSNVTYKCRPLEITLFEYDKCEGTTNEQTINYKSSLYIVDHVLFRLENHTI